MSGEKPYSLWAIVFVVAALVAMFFLSGLWSQNRMKVDAPSYYAYLPAAIIHHDLTLKFVDANPTFYQDKLWYYTSETGAKVIHHPLGISISLLPFFLAGHLAAILTGQPQDGYSMPYQNAASIGVLIYLFIGLLFLRKILLRLFSEKITALTILAVVLGTNLFWYSSAEGLMSHSISFSFTCVCIYYFFQWLDAGKTKYFFLFSFLFSLIILIRPNSIILIFYFLIFGILSKGSLRQFAGLLKPRVVLPGLLVFIFLWFLQMLYWKLVAGSWIYNTYPDQPFILSSPQLIPFLFGFNKGFFIYTPVMLFSIFGMISIYKRSKPHFYSILSIFCIGVYLFSSWWVWNYGISFGMRTMIDLYPIFCIPLAASFSLISSKGKILSIAFPTFIFLLIGFNLFQTWQYKNGLLHFDSMTRKAYFTGLFQTNSSWEWRDALQPIDFESRRKGLQPVTYDKDYFEKLSPDNYLTIRGSNFKLWNVDSQKLNCVFVSGKLVEAGTAFNFIRLGGDTFAIRSYSGKYISVQPQARDVLAAVSGQIGSEEKFILKQVDDEWNRITLRSMNGKYVTLVQPWNDMLCANSDTISRECTFRIYSLYKK